MKNGIAVVGMGHWGKNLVRNFFELGALTAIGDSRAEVGKVAAEKFPGVSFSTDYSAILADKSIHAVALATPAVMHYQMVKMALEAGKDVFVEKPLAINVRDGQELAALAKKSGRILMVGHILQYHPAYSALKKLVNEGALGQIRYVYSNRLNIGKIRTEENILWSFAPHDISVILGLLGEDPSSVSCHGAGYLNREVTDITVSQFVFPSGVQGHIFVSWLHPFKEQRLVVVGSEKMAVFDDTVTDKLKLYPHKVEWKDRIPTAVAAPHETVPLSADEPLRKECEQFINSIQTRMAPPTDAEEGLRVLRILDACQRSLDTGGRYVSLTEATPPAKPYFVHPTAFVDEPCEIGAGTKIWHFSHVMKNAKIGEKCIFGQNCNIDGGTVIGNNVKVQNNVSIYTGAVIEDDVFLGPSCVLTNVTNPRSQVLRHSLYEKTLIRRGASVGANATIVCGATIGRYAFVAAGAVVAKDVPDYALMMGVPARRVGWVSRHGLPMKTPDKKGIYTCPESGLKYKEVEPGVLKCLDLDEEAPLPQELREGKKFYDDIVHPGERLQ